MSKEFDLDMVYDKRLTKKELCQLITDSYDNEFIVLFLPRSKNNADILIRSFESELLKDPNCKKEELEKCGQKKISNVPCLCNVCKEGETK